MADTDVVESTDSNQWKSEKFRQKVVGQIQEVMTKTDVTVPKSSTELEEQIFGKASTREEYLALAARIIVHIRDLKTKPITLTPSEATETTEDAS